LLDFIVGALRSLGCRVLFTSNPSEAPFRITFEAPHGERIGLVVYAFLANQRLTTNRPVDEHRFQVKYGAKDGKLLRLWQDAYGLYVTLFMGINPDLGFFVGADPVLHSPTKMFISIEFKQSQVDRILQNGWVCWERDRRSADDRPIEVLVGGTADSFLRYVRFEREALAEDQGHRQLLAERSDFLGLGLGLQAKPQLPGPPPAERLHQLAQEFQLTPAEVLDLIEKAPRLHMAVRGWVAEEHLHRELRLVNDVSECAKITTEGGADIALRFTGVPLTIECKNVLRATTSEGLARIDFQRTRASKTDPCSRYYRVDDFDVVAACLHAVTEHWEFRYIVPWRLDRHKWCSGRLSNNVRVDERWGSDPHQILEEAARRTHSA
jgi:hypothetical protein